MCNRVCPSSLTLLQFTALLAILSPLPTLVILCCSAQTNGGGPIYSTIAAQQHAFGELAIQSHAETPEIRKLRRHTEQVTRHSNILTHDVRFYLRELPRGVKLARLLEEYNEEAWVSYSALYQLNWDKEWRLDSIYQTYDDARKTIEKARYERPFKISTLWAGVTWEEELEQLAAKKFQSIVAIFSDLFPGVLRAAKAAEDSLTKMEWLAADMQKIVSMDEKSIQSMRAIYPWESDVPLWLELDGLVRDPQVPIALARVRYDLETFRTIIRTLEDIRIRNNVTLPGPPFLL